MKFKESGGSIVGQEDLVHLRELVNVHVIRDASDQPTIGDRFRLPTFGNSQSTAELDPESTKSFIDLAGNEIRRELAGYETHCFAIGAYNQYFRAIRAERYRRGN